VARDTKGGNDVLHYTLLSVTPPSDIENYVASSNSCREVDGDSEEEEGKGEKNPSSQRRSKLNSTKQRKTNTKNQNKIKSEGECDSDEESGVSVEESFDEAENIAPRKTALNRKGVGRGRGKVATIEKSRVTKTVPIKKNRTGRGK
jgi:hypothetical protein